MQLQLRYKSDHEKERMIQILSTAATVKKISKPYKSGKYYRIYLNIE
ncbi:hypothetical protein [Clostridium saccharobutylicum]|uniref:Uncharacterized protein n=1 Tax=Clostridium saccharobutylicum TaxID=169679 RepID=A0A1S8NJT1_CLOSA|nr:hypothetical protein [Clostridium saccharobutylicum]OOM16749.1 hypothetical protein CLOSAC_10430 [Clostridium saccharobutylicum]